jgi:PEP-CTERM motif
MKLKTTLVLVALAFAGSAASAATVGVLRDPVTGAAFADNPVLGPHGAEVHADYQSSGPVDDVYNFSINGVSDLLVTANEYEANGVQLNPADFTLYKGTSTGGSGSAATQIGSVFSFTGADIKTTVFSNLAIGSYFFEITGDASKPLGADYDVKIDAPGSSGPLPAVPEPTNMALLLAGLGLMGFMAKRRSQN